MQFLVTGGAGFIGSHVVDRLIADGHAVTVLDDLSNGRRENVHPRATLVVGDVAEAALVSSLMSNMDGVFHLAAIASVQVCEMEPARAEATNITGTENIFAAASATGTPVIYASSAAVYGDNPNIPLGEDAATVPLGNYGRQKLENEKIAARQPTVPSVGLRFFNVYGPRQDPASPYCGVISIFMKRASEGVPLTFFGDGEQTRDFIYVGDVVNLLMAAHANARGQSVVNGCTGIATSLKQLAATIGTVRARPITTTHADPRGGDIRHSLGNPSRASALLGFTARTMLADGLRHLAASDA